MKLLNLGTKTIFGKIVGVTTTGGERYYFIKKGNTISFIPATALEMI